MRKAPANAILRKTAGATFAVVALAAVLLLSSLPAPVSTAAADNTDPPLAESRVLPEFEGLPSPLTWLQDIHSGIHYRRATSNELLNNGWDPGTYLVEMTDLGWVRQGAPTVSMLLPRSDLSVQLVTLDLQQTEQGMAHVEHLADGTSRSFTPTFHHYVTDNSEEQLRSYVENGGGPVLQIVGSSGRGFYGEGIHGQAFVQVWGPEPHWLLDQIGTASGGVVDPNNVALVTLLDPLTPFPLENGDASTCPFGLTLVCQQTCRYLGWYCPPPPPQCSDGKDNDGDGKVDYPSDPGCSSSSDNDEYDAPPPQCSDGKDNDGDQWTDYPSDPGCSSSSDNTESEGDVTRNLGLFGEVKWCTKFKGNWDSRLATVGGNIRDGFNGNGGTRVYVSHVVSHCWIANDDAHATTCDRDGCGTYVYNKCNGSATCYRDRAWTDVKRARDDGYSFPQLHNVQVVHYGIMSYGTGSVCGLASFPSGSPNFGSSSGPAPSGDSVTVETDANCAPWVPTHEVGHTFDATHGDSCYDGGWTVMRSGEPTRKNWFCDANRANINYCTDFMAECPRSGTA